MFGITSRPAMILALIVLVLLVSVLLRRSLQRFAKEISDNASTWRLYLRGQGTVLFLFLLGGASLSWGSWALARYVPGISGADEGGRLTEFRDVNPSEHPVYEEVEAKSYRRITVMTRTTAPENASATVTLYDDQDGKTKGEIKRIDSAASAWSRWDHENANRNLSLVIESSNQPGVSKATKVDVLIYLSTK
jgi:hypothetical protein